MTEPIRRPIQGCGTIAGSQDIPGDSTHPSAHHNL